MRVELYGRCKVLARRTPLSRAPATRVPFRLVWFELPDIIRLGAYWVSDEAQIVHHQLELLVAQGRLRTEDTGEECRRVTEKVVVVALQRRVLWRIVELVPFLNRRGPSRGGMRVRMGERHRTIAHRVGAFPDIVPIARVDVQGAVRCLTSTRDVRQVRGAPRVVVVSSVSTQYGPSASQSGRGSRRWRPVAYQTASPG